MPLFNRPIKIFKGIEEVHQSISSAGETGIFIFDEQI
jgi:hypothetical protein